MCGKERGGGGRGKVERERWVSQIQGPFVLRVEMITRGREQTQKQMTGYNFRRVRAEEELGPRYLKQQHAELNETKKKFPSSLNFCFKQAYKMATYGGAVCNCLRVELIQNARQREINLKMKQEEEESAFTDL